MKRLLSYSAPHPRLPPSTITEQIGCFRLPLVVQRIQASEPGKEAHARLGSGVQHDPLDATATVTFFASTMATGWPAIHNK